MNKQKKQLLIILIASILLIQVSADENNTCADNPLLPHLETFIKEQNAFIKGEEDEQELKRFLQQIINEDAGEDYEEDQEGIEKRRNLINWGKIKKAKDKLKGKGKEYKEKKEGKRGERDGKKKGGRPYDRDGEEEGREDREDKKKGGWRDKFSDKKEGWKEKKEGMKDKREEKKKGWSEKKQAWREKFKEKKEQKKAEIRKKFEEIKKKARQTIKKAILSQMFDLQDLESIKSAQPQVIEEQLEICTGLKGTPSCCTKNQIKKFKKLTKGYYLKKLKKKPTSNKFYKKLEKEFENDTECPMENMKRIYFSFKQEELIKNALKAERECQKQSILINGNLIRGTICQACMDPAQYEKYFDGEGHHLSLNIVPETIREYKEAMNTQFQCIDDSLKQLREAYGSTIEKIEKKMAEEEDDSCNSVLDKVKLILKEQKSEEKDGGIKCDYNPSFYGDGCLQEIEDDSDYDGESEEDMRRRRVLQESHHGGYVENAHGVSNVYEKDLEEEQELEALPDMLEIQEQYEEEQAIEELDEGDGYQEENSSINGNDSKGQLIGFMLINIVLVIFYI